MKKRLYLIILALVALIALILIANFIFVSAPSNDLRVYFLDVGQGDSALIRTPDQRNILVDGGPDDSVIRELGKILPWYDRRIDLIILSHPHSDHVRGLIEVLKRYQVEKVLMTGVLHTAPDYLEWLELLKDKKTAVKLADRQQRIGLGNEIYIDVLYPAQSVAGQEFSNLNNSSIVLRLVHGDNSFLMLGDLETGMDDELISVAKNLESTVIKIAHHGASNGSSQSLVEKIHPRYAVISVGVNNKFGHPSLLTLWYLEQNGIETLRTDEKGTIIFASDAKSLKILNE